MPQTLYKPFSNLHRTLKCAILEAHNPLNYWGNLAPSSAVKLVGNYAGKFGEVMRRGTVFLLLFIVFVAGVIGVSQFLRTQPALNITFAVDSLAVDWVREAANRFNASSPLVNGTQRIQVEVSVIGDMDVWEGEANWTTQNHPDGWIPSSSVSLSYAQSANVPMQAVADSTARTLLVWGGYASRVAIITQDGTVPFDWETVQVAAEAASWRQLGGDPSWGFVKLAFPIPDSTMTGLAALLSGAANFNDTDDLSGGSTRGTDFYNWLTPIIASVPNFQTLGADVAKTVARGPSTVEIAILPESQWLLNLSAMIGNESVVLSYPAYDFVFDFPVARWDDLQTTETERAAVKAFADWLLTGKEQSFLVEKGLRPALGEVPTTASLFSGATQYGIQLTPTFQSIQAPSRTDAQGLMQWFATNQRR